MILKHAAMKAFNSALFSSAVVFEAVGDVVFY